MLFYNKNKIVGELKEGIYRKRVDSRIHKMKMFDGYGIDKNIVVQLEKEGCKEIRIKEMDTENILSCQFETFTKNMIEKNFDGLQCFLHGKFWTQSNPKQELLLK